LRRRRETARRQIAFCLGTTKAHPICDERALRGIDPEATLEPIVVHEAFAVE
jgi:hypothetical protein